MTSKERDKKNSANLFYSNNQQNHQDILMDVFNLYEKYISSDFSKRDKMIFEFLDLLSETELQTARYCVRISTTMNDGLWRDIFDLYKR